METKTSGLTSTADIMVFAESREDLQEIIKILIVEARFIRLKMNGSKTTLWQFGRINSENRNITIVDRDLKEDIEAVV